MDLYGKFILSPVQLHDSSCEMLSDTPTLKRDVETQFKHVSFLDDSISCLPFISNWVAVIRNQILIGTLIGTSILNKMNAFLKLTSRFKFRKSIH